MRTAALKDQRTSLPKRRSLRLKGISEVYAEDSKQVNSCAQSQADGGSNSSIVNHVKTEVIDLEESTSSSMSNYSSIASVAENRDTEHCCNKGSECADDEQNFQDISLKDLRAWCKAKKRKAPEIVSERADTKSIRHPDQSQTWNLKDVKPTEEELDLEEPLIALKLKRPKSSPTKRNRNKDAETSSQCAVPIEAATLKTDKIPSSAGQASSLVATVDESTTKKLHKRSATNLDRSKIAIGDSKEKVREEISFAEAENNSMLSARSLKNRPCGGILDIVCNIKSEDVNIYSDDEFGKSSSLESNSFDHSSAELRQKTRRDHWNGEQSCFTSHPLDVDDISDNFLELSCTVKVESLDDIVMQEKTTDMVSSLDFIGKVNYDEKPSDDLTNAHMLRNVDLSSMGDEYLPCSLNQVPDDYLEIHEYSARGGVQENMQESVKTVKEVSPIDEHNSELVSTVLVIGSDFCGGTERKCTSLEEIVEKQAEGQLDSLVCHSDKTREMSVHTDYTFLCNKMHDFVDTANFVAQDGQLESIVYDAINNHPQVKTDETKSCVKVPDSAGIQILLTDQFPSNCSSAAKVSPHGQSVLSDQIDFSSMVGKHLNMKTDGDICTSIDDDQRSIKGFDLPSQFFQSCINMEKTNDEASGSARKLLSSGSEETQELSVGAPTSTVSSQETDGHIDMETELLIDAGSIEEHAPKKLLSKRKIISPTSQEKLCKALTQIDLCDGVQKLRRNVLFEDCDKTRRTSPESGNKQDQLFSRTERTAQRLKSRNSFSPVAKGILKSTESPSPCRVACSCMTGSSIRMDTEKAVEFSQRQMHDIENIATKLIRSLKYMKSIVDETLSSEGHSLRPNFSTAEIRAASEDASEIERTTRKWLTIMTKDCNRFCKILTLAGKKVVSQLDVRKNRRKIIFADEAGGKLCHVKVFNEEPTSLLSECQKDC